MINIDFKEGTLLIRGDECELEPIKEYITYDERTNCYRSLAMHYASIIMSLHRLKAEYIDKARNYSTLDINYSPGSPPRDYQEAALKHWLKNNGQGLVIMPTGSGKTFLANMAIAHIKRSTFIVVPTIDLMHQWASQLESNFKIPIGMLGGGNKEITDITVSTYESAVLRMDFIGNRFGFIIYDECHHLPAFSSRQSAQM